MLIYLNYRCPYCGKEYKERWKKGIKGDILRHCEDDTYQNDDYGCGNQFLIGIPFLRNVNVTTARIEWKSTESDLRDIMSKVAEE